MKHLIFLLLIICSQAVLAIESQPTTLCSQVPGVGGGPAWKYCLHRYADSDNDLLIYLHGSGGSEYDWENGELEQKILQTWREQGVRPPSVITISMGPTWLMTEKNASPASGLLDYFLAVILPTAKQLAGAKIEKTYLLGLSMGGFNAAQLYLKTPQLFSRVALLCPAMSTITPFATQAEVQNYITMTKASPQLVDQIIQLAKAFMPTLNDWNNHSPNVLALQKVTPQSPPLYVANGAADPYGFSLGNELFVKDVIKAGGSVVSDFYPNAGHCKLNPQKAAQALLPE